MVEIASHTTEQQIADSRPMRVQRGIFVLRYVSSSANGAAPELVVTAPESSGVEFVSIGAMADTAVLGMPGDAVVLRSNHDSAVFLSIESHLAGDNRNVHVTLERVSSAGRPIGRPLLPSPIDNDKVDIAPTLEILAHVSRRGDLVVAAGEWICGPQVPMAIEGLELRWAGSPPLLEIRTSAVIYSQGRKQQKPTPVGRFVGSRGKAAPLVGLKFELSGPRAPNFELCCEALFLGGAVILKTGSLIEISGPTGREPLVGLKLSLTAETALVRDHRVLVHERQAWGLGRNSAETAFPKAQPQNGPRGIRVFRAGRSRSLLGSSS